MTVLAKIRGRLREFIDWSNPVVQWTVGVLTIAAILSGWIVAWRQTEALAVAHAGNVPPPAADPEKQQPNGVKPQPLVSSPYNQLHALPLALAAADEGSVPARSEDGELLIETATACLKKLSARSIEISFGGTLQDDETGATTADAMIYTVRGPYGEAIASGIELTPDGSASDHH